MRPLPPMRGVIDLNADLGESYGTWRLGDDEAMLRVVTSANVACGFHAGDPLTLRQTCAAAVSARVAIGAQVSYRDLVGFGRRFLDASPDELAADVLYQIGALDAMCGGGVTYVKPHGALYNAAVRHEGHAGAVVAAVRAFHRPLAILGLPGSRLLELADEAGLPIVREAFADRAYTATGELVPRSEPGAVLHDPSEVAARAVQMVSTHQVRAITGELVEVAPDSICIHGDTPGAVAIAVAVRQALEEAGVEIAPFSGATG